MSKRKIRRRFEAVNPLPMALEVKFQTPPTIQEQIARYMRDHERFLSNAKKADDDVEDASDDEEAHDPSPHELVIDELTNRHVTRWEYALMQRDRQRFDAELKKRIDESRQSKANEEPPLAAPKAAKKPVRNSIRTGLGGEPDGEE